MSVRNPFLRALAALTVSIAISAAGYAVLVIFPFHLLELQMHWEYRSTNQLMDFEFFILAMLFITLVAMCVLTRLIYERLKPESAVSRSAYGLRPDV
jgi:hypothetical protein